LRMEAGETYSRQVELAAAPVGQRAVLVPATSHLLHLQDAPLLPHSHSAAVHHSGEQQQQLQQLHAVQHQQQQPAVHRSSSVLPVRTVNKDGFIHLVLDADKHVNIMDYLKNEILDETMLKRIDREVLVGHKEVEVNSTNEVKPGSEVKSAVIPVSSNQQRPVIGQNQHAVKPKKVPETRKKVKRKEKVARGKNYACDQCKAAFFSSKDLKRHALKHSGEKPYSCPFCDQKFTSPSSRVCHIRTIHDKSQEFTCPMCSKGFNQRSNMVKHLRTIHLDLITLQCTDCPRKFNQKSALRRHIKIVHNRELPHACDQCDRKFALAESLKKHKEAIHVKSRGFPCSQCEYAASRADILRIHIKKIHTKDWTYICSVCKLKGVEWGCILPKELRRHMLARHQEEYLRMQKENISFKKEKKENNQTPGVKHHSQLPLPAQPHTSAVDVGQFKDPQPAASRVATLEEKVRSLLNRIREPLQFTSQLEAEIRARACKAPHSVLNFANADTSMSLDKPISDPNPSNTQQSNNVIIDSSRQYSTNQVNAAHTVVLPAAGKVNFTRAFIGNEANQLNTSSSVVAFPSELEHSSTTNENMLNHSNFVTSSKSGHLDNTTSSSNLNSSNHVNNLAHSHPSSNIQEYISDTQTLVDHRMNYSEPQLSLVYQEEAPVSHIVTVDENGRPHQLQEITTGWRWLQQSAGGLFVASTRSDPAAPMILASQSTDQSTNSLPTRLVSKVDANERDVMFKQIDRERKEVSRQVSKEVGDGILLQQDHNHQHQHYAISKQDQLTLVEKGSSLQLCSAAESQVLMPTRQNPKEIVLDKEKGRTEEIYIIREGDRELVQYHHI